MNDVVTPGRRITEDPDLRALLQRTRTIAVIGIKPETHAEQPAHYVPAFAQSRGYLLIPVPVYYPDVREILGVPVVRSLAEISGPVDLVNVFRRSEDVPKHLDELLAARPRAAWLQQGIRNETVALRLLQAGIDVVQDRCLLVDIQRLR
ncbi:MAG: CoA-binding protein [Deltaproteobacteria bacterium]|nr:CoA-binding protein [Deltaproteobacteria bacterium]